MAARHATLSLAALLAAGGGVRGFFDRQDPTNNRHGVVIF
jgi:hypothetical protein